MKRTNRVVAPKHYDLPAKLTEAEKARLMKNAVELTGIEWEIVTQRFHDEMDQAKVEAGMKPWELWGDKRSRRENTVEI